MPAAVLRPNELFVSISHTRVEVDPNAVNMWGRSEGQPLIADKTIAIECGHAQIAATIRRANVALRELQTGIGTMRQKPALVH